MKRMTGIDITELPEAVKIPEWHKVELAKRLQAYHDNPQAGSPWSEIKNRIVEGL